MAKFSVIIPARNAGKTLEKCLIAIANQTFQDKQIVVVDDCSTDSTKEIATKYSHVISSDKRLGVGVARNLGARNSKGEILVFTDSDCVASQFWLETIYNDMLSMGVKAWASGYKDNLEKGTFISDFANIELEYRRRDRNKKGFVKTAVANNFACFREIFEKYGCFPEDGLASEDIVLTSKMSREEKIYWNPENGVYHYHKNKVVSYLKQQFWFSKDTIRRYFQFPFLLFIKTHQGYSLYLEIFFSAVSLLGIILAFFSKNLPYLGISFISLSLIILINLGFYSHAIKKRGVTFIIRIIPLQIIRDIVCAVGSLVGLFLGLFVDLKRKLSKFRLE